MMTEQEAYEKMVELLQDGVGILTTAGVDPRIPTIDNVGHREGMRLQTATPVRHAGFGLFLAETADGGQISFDGGGAMTRVTVDGNDWAFSWTPLRGDTREQLKSIGYDFEAALNAVWERVVD